MAVLLLIDLVEKPAAAKCVFCAFCAAEHLAYRTVDLRELVA